MENYHWGANIFLKTFAICVRKSTGFIWLLSLVNMVVHHPSGLLHFRFPNKMSSDFHQGDFFTPNRQDKLWGPHSHRGSFPSGQAVGA